MTVNSMYTDFPPQPSNPSDSDRYFLSCYALKQMGRLEDFENIKSLTAPPPDITTIVQAGEFKGHKIGVIGGGLAGLAAGFELRKLGFDITIFEAQADRIGGRVYTHYFNQDKTLYGELGAMRIPVTHESVWHYIKLFGLDTRTFVQSNNNGIIYLRAAHARNDSEGMSVKRNIYPKYNLTQWEKSKSWQQLLYYGYDSQLLCAASAQRKEILQVKPDYNPYTLYWDGQNTRQMLQSANLSEEAISLLANLYPIAGNFLYNSYIDFIQEDYPVDLSFLYEIQGGIVKLPIAFYNSIRNINLDAVYPKIPKACLGNVYWKAGNWVTGIGKAGDRGGVTLTYSSSKDSKPLYEDFEYVICAIPFSTLRTMTIDPLFSPRKMQAIKEVNYGNAAKKLLLCSHRFWEEGGPKDKIVGGHSYTDLPLTSLWYPSDHAQYIYNRMKNMPNSNPQHSPQIPDSLKLALAKEPGVLLAYNFNQDATRLGELPYNTHFEEVKREIEKVHGFPRGYLNFIAIEFKTVDWETEQWFRGAFCFFSPQQKSLFSYAMSIPEYDNRVFFAGEHISAKHRWMQGALKSGMEAANGLARACKAHNRVIDSNANLF